MTSETAAPQRIYVITGEASGDAHAARVIRCILQDHPHLQFRGMGGDEMNALGVGLVEHVRNTSIMGFAEVIARLGFLRKLIQRVQADILEFQPDRILLVDYPGFNLRIAQWANAQGMAVDMYISPQVWAWKRHRVHRIARDIDRLHVILPFEPESYAGLDLEVEYVGHPLLETIGAEPEWDATQRMEWRAQHGVDGDRPLLALLPGSRTQELQRMLPVFEATAAGLPDWQVIIAGAPGRTAADYPTDLPVRFGITPEVYRAADLGLITSGTATLEAALAGLPQVVAYKTSPLTYRIAKAFSRVRFISLVNLILDREAVPECIQSDCTPDTLLRALQDVASEQGMKQQAQDQADLRRALSKEGASQRVAEALMRPLMG